MRRFLELIGWRRADEPLPELGLRQRIAGTIAVVVVAVVIIWALNRVF